MVITGLIGHESSFVPTHILAMSLFSLEQISIGKLLLSISLVKVVFAYSQE